MRVLFELFPVALGGALGACSRYLIGLLATVLWPQFPLGTLSVNALGSFMAGILLALALLGGSPSHSLKLFLMTGFLGAFTTFSAFSFETLELWLGQERGLALVNASANLGLSLAAVSAGYALTQRMQG